MTHWPIYFTATEFVRKKLIFIILWNTFNYLKSITHTFTFEFCSTKILNIHV